ncbi:hypothetical protein CDCA_CDCA19G4627 [Cyanidium caldarium]|uniref:Uncharacterized protein n=1 Tax=Cyanidium caldarium TaxID=2771 RepID=A0AAV9J1Z4_CYACA|nr:hypothetical protein CDCA_CDCA19G4627 [Cyanidium caldarium]|eukprot:ctg_1044.g374
MSDNSDAGGWNGDEDEVNLPDDYLEDEAAEPLPEGQVEGEAGERAEGDEEEAEAERELAAATPEDATATVLDGGAAAEPPGRITTRFMTKYERARVLGTRALQISMGAPVLVDLEGESDPLQIAMKELRAKRIPLKIRRHLPNGAYEDWSVNELIID